LKALSAKAKYTLISAVLGCLGSINIVLIGVHITSIYLYLSVLSRSFLVNAYITMGIATASTLTLILGTYLILKEKGWIGGVINLAGGTATLILCYYFTSIFPLLRQLEPVGYLLAAPALASGLLTLFTLKKPELFVENIHPRPY